MMVVMDDCQSLGNAEQKLTDRVAPVVDELQRAALSLQIPIMAVCPDLREDRRSLPQAWSDRAPSADVIMVMEIDLERTKRLIEPIRRSPSTSSRTVAGKRVNWPSTSSQL